MPNNRQTVIVGVDIGTEFTKVVVLEDGHDPEIVRNEVGDHTTPTVVSFDANNAKLRNIGATANLKAKHNTVLHLNRHLPGEKDGDDEGTDDVLAPFYQFQLVSDDGCGWKVTNLDYKYKAGKGDGVDDGDDASSTKSSFSSSALLAMLLGNVQKNVQSTLRRRQQTVAATSSNEDYSATDPTIEFVYAVSCPPEMTPEAKQSMLDAVFAGVRMEEVVLVERGGAYLASYERKFQGQGTKHTVLIVDMGHAETTVTVLGIRPEGGSSSFKEDLHLLASVRSKSLGAGNVDVLLWEHFQSTMPELQGVTKNSKAGQRLLAGAANLKHLLSQSSKASVTVEKVGGEGGDYDSTLTATRKMLVDLCQGTDVHKLTTLIDKALQQAGITSDDDAGFDWQQLDAIEVVGGGCRIPFVKETIETAVAAVAGKTISLSYSMDDTSAALGAALVAHSDIFKESALDDVATSGTILARWAPTTMPYTDIQAALRRAEQDMAACDDEMQQRAATLNQLEARMLELRSAQYGSTHGGLLPDDLFAYLDEVENWVFFSEHAEEASNDDIQAKWDDFKSKTSEWSTLYQDAVDSDQKAMEADMEAEAQRAKLERDAAETGDEEDDHDNRRLPKKRRMEIVVKNMNEGLELFDNGHYRKYQLEVFTSHQSYRRLEVLLTIAFLCLDVKSTNRVCRCSVRQGSQSLRQIYRFDPFGCSRSQVGEADIEFESGACMDEAWTARRSSPLLQRCLGLGRAQLQSTVPTGFGLLRKM